MKDMLDTSSDEDVKEHKIKIKVVGKPPHARVKDGVKDVVKDGVKDGDKVKDEVKDGVKVEVRVKVRVKSILDSSSEEEEGGGDKNKPKPVAVKQERVEVGRIG